MGSESCIVVGAERRTQSYSGRHVIVTVVSSSPSISLHHLCVSPSLVWVSNQNTPLIQIEMCLYHRVRNGIRYCKLASNIDQILVCSDHFWKLWPQHWHISPCVKMIWPNSCLLYLAYASSSGEALWLIWSHVCFHLTKSNVHSLLALCFFGPYQLLFTC